MWSLKCKPHHDSSFSALYKKVIFWTSTRAMIQSNLLEKEGDACGKGIGLGRVIGMMSTVKTVTRQLMPRAGGHLDGMQR